MRILSRVSGAGRAVIALALVLGVTGCTTAAPAKPSGTQAPTTPRVVATASFLADIASHVAGDRLQVDTLVPNGQDPHHYEPTPADVVRVAESDLLIINGGGFEGFLETLVRNVGEGTPIVEASQGLASREPPDDKAHDSQHKHDVDPHYWLNPLNVVHYTGVIRDALSEVDPEGAPIYAANAESYTEELLDLDAWIAQQVETIPPRRRLLVTGHESFGYYADRYGLRVVGAILPSTTSGSAPSAQQLALLVTRIHEAGAPAIFLETGSDPRLAEQVAREANVRVLELYTHSLSPSEGPAPSYIEMMRYNTRTIVEALR